MGGTLQEDNQQLDREVGSHRLAGVEGVGTLRWEDMAGQSETSAEVEAPPLAGAQTCHHACPSQPCVVSAYMHRPSSKPHRRGNSIFEMLLKVLHFPQSLQQWKICRQFDSGRT